METKIIIKNRRGKKLAAVWHLPKNKTNKTVVFTHSFKGDKDCDTLGKNFAEAVAKEGIAAIRFDCYGTGKSEGDFIEATVTSEAEDLEDVMEFVRQQGYTDICLAGSSQGAAVSILAADQNVKCLIFCSPAFDMTVLYDRYKEEFKGKDFIIKLKHRTGEKVKVGRAMWEEFGKIKLDDKIKSITQPVLAVHAEKDHLHHDPDKIKRYTGSFAGPATMKVIKGAGHDFLDPAKEREVLELSLKWLKKNL